MALQKLLNFGTCWNLLKRKQRLAERSPNIWAPAPHAMHTLTTSDALSGPVKLSCQTLLVFKTVLHYPLNQSMAYHDAHHKADNSTQVEAMRRPFEGSGESWKSDDGLVYNYTIST